LAGGSLKQLKTLWWISLIVKLAISALVPLSADESYYWVWSRFPELSYYDHPAMVAWIFKAGDLFLGFANAVRWPAVILGHLTLLVWFLILRDYLNVEKIKWYFYLVLFSPMLGFGSLAVTPDLPVIFFWSLSIYFFIQLLQNGKMLNYGLLGLSLGLGFCSKYHIVLFVPSILLFLTFEKKWSAVKFRGVCLTILLGLIGSLPVIIWNYQHEFASIRFQLNHGLGREDYKFYWTWSYILAQILIVFPVIAYLAFKAKPKAELRSLIYLSWFPILFFFLTSFRGIVEANWPIVAYPSLFALAIMAAGSFKPIRITNAFWILVALLVILQVRFNFLKNAPEKMQELTRYQVIDDVRPQYEPLYCQNYQMCSALWYLSKKPIYKIWGMSRTDYFDNFDQGFPGMLPSQFFLAMREGDPMPSWFEKDKQKIEVVQRLENRLLIVKITQ